MDTSHFQPHQLRVVEEKAELDEKLGKLRAFFDGSVFPTVNKAEQYRLVYQAELMGKYSRVLGERIAAFAAEVDPVVADPGKHEAAS